MGQIQTEIHPVFVAVCIQNTTNKKEVSICFSAFTIGRKNLPTSSKTEDNTRVQASIQDDRER